MPDAFHSTRAFVLDTPNLLLGLLNETDVDGIYQLYSDWKVAQELRRIAYPFSHTDAQEFIAQAQQMFAQRSGYMLGIFTRERAAFIGVNVVSVPARNEVLSAEERAEAEGLGILGYSVLPEYWGKGYATESSLRMICFAFDELRLTTLQASIRQGHGASRRVIERLGFRVVEEGLEEEPSYGGPAHIVDRYWLRREQWASPQDPLIQT